MVERSFAWVNQFRRLRVRYDKCADIQAFLSRVHAGLFAIPEENLGNRIAAHCAFPSQVGKLQ